MTRKPSNADTTADIQARIDSGFYNTRAIMDIVAEKLLDDMLDGHIPHRPDHQCVCGGSGVRMHFDSDYGTYDVPCDCVLTGGAA